MYDPKLLACTDPDKFNYNCLVEKGYAFPFETYMLIKDFHF